MSINKAIISGNLTRDAELHETNANGTPVLNFTVAVNDRRRNGQTGEWEDYANFIDCTLFGKRAEAIHQFMVKGTKVAIEGKLRWSQWEDKETGKNRNKVGVLVDEIEFMNQRGGNGGGGAAPASAPAPAADDGAYDEDIPF